MKIAKLCWPSALALILLASCNSENTAQKDVSAIPSAAAPSPAAAASAKPEIELYMVTVENLLLRDKPTKAGSKVLAKFKEGEFVEGSGEVSPNKEEATIRGIPMKEAYHQVVSTTPEQHKGWAFGGALLRVYAGTRATSPDLGKLSQFSAFLKTLGTKKLESGKKAWDYVNSNFSNASGTLADAAFILLDDFMRRLQMEGEFYTMTEKLQWAEEDYMIIHDHKFDMNKFPATKSLADNGFSLAVGEGMVFPVVDMTKMQQFFAGKVTPPMRAFLDQTLKEDQVPAWSDGGIIIPLEELADRAVFWEKFNWENPYFVLRERTQESERWTRLVILNGDANTPTFDSETNMITEDFKKVWDYILAKYPGTELGKAVKEITTLASSTGWKRNPQVEAFQKKFQQ